MSTFSMNLGISPALCKNYAWNLGICLGYQVAAVVAARVMSLVLKSKYFDKVSFWAKGYTAIITPAVVACLLPAPRLAMVSTLPAFILSLLPIALSVACYFTHGKEATCILGSAGLQAAYPMGSITILNSAILGPAWAIEGISTAIFI